ncbi:MAG TPA: sigma-70 family RNA polymerase sigma factor [Anaeromyxobacteraceae bacterium]|nr:sigma-70 family RNA polymerase sigma factor [Anaeromyxobacteraceae bacterium]
MNGTPTSLADLELRVRHQLSTGHADAAATSVIELLGPGVLRYLCSLLPEDDACDAFSEFQQCLWRGLPRFRWECPLRAWAWRLAWHAAVRCMRDGYRRRREPLSPELAESSPAPGTGTAWLEGRSEQLEALGEELGARDRTLLALRLGRNLAWEQVAAAFAAEGEAISAAALRKRFERLKERLAGMARARGLVA